MRTWNHTPLLKYLPFFIAGIITTVFLHAIPFSFAIGTIVLFLSVEFFLIRSKNVFTRYKWRHIHFFFISAGFFISGSLLTQVHTAVESKNYFRNEENITSYVAIVDADFTDKPKSLRTTLRIAQVQSNGQWKNVSGNILCYFSKADTLHQLKYGDKIVFQSSPKPVPGIVNPGQFDYKRYLHFHQVEEQIFLKPNQYAVIGSDCANPILASSINIRHSVLKILSDLNIEGQEFAVLSALLVGTTDQINQETINAYSASGALHVLSVSGLHVGIVYAALNFLLGFMNKRKKWKVIKIIMCLLFIGAYAVITGLSPSVLRSAAMVAFVAVGSLSGKRTHMYNSLAAAAMLLLVWDPYILMQVGFQLSFLAVLGIIFFQPHVKEWYMPNTFIGTQIWNIIAVSIAAQIATFPLGLLYFHQFPVYFLFSNLIVIPLSSLILYCGMMLIVLFKVPIISIALGWLLTKLVWSLNTIVAFIEQLPFSLINGITISILQTYIIYGAIVFISFYFINYRIQYLRWSLALASLLMITFIFENFQRHDDKTLIVYSIKGNNSVAVYSAGKEFLFANTGLANDRSTMLFNILHNRWESGVSDDQSILIPNTDTTFRSDNFMIHRNLSHVGDKSILFLSDSISNQSIAQISPNYIVYGGCNFTKAKMLLTEFNQSQLLFTNSSDKKFIRYLKRQSANHKNMYVADGNNAYVATL